MRRVGLKVALKRLQHKRRSARLVKTRIAIRSELNGKVYSEAEVAELVSMHKSE